MYSIQLSICFSLALLSLGQAQVACNLRSLYSRLLDDASLSDAFCKEFRDHTVNSKDFLYQFGTNCEAYRAEISTGCSLFGTTTMQIMPQITPTVVTVTETVTNSRSAGICTPSVKTVTVPSESQPQRQRQQPTDLSLIVSSSGMSLYAPPQVPIGMDKDSSIPDPVHAAPSSFLTTPTASPFSTMSPPASFFVPFSSVLTTTLSTIYQSSISSLATQAPTSTDRYVVPAPSPSAVDRHVFSPLGDLTIDETTSAISGALTVPHDANSGADDASSSMTIVYLNDASPGTCVHMKGSWTPLYTKAVYECVAKTRAPDFDSENYPNASTGLSLTAEDGSSSITNSRAFGPQAEGDYEEASLSLFVTKDKTYTVEFWACGSGETLVVGELSCTYYA